MVQLFLPISSPSTLLTETPSVEVVSIRLPVIVTPGAVVAEMPPCRCVLSGAMFCVRSLMMLPVISSPDEQAAGL